jgi:hypothetical protein
MSPTQYVVRIQDWDWPLHMGIKPRSSMGADSVDELICSETLIIDGLVLLPGEHRSERIQLRLNPLPREIICDGCEHRNLGRLHRKPVEQSDLCFYASLFLPADTLQKAILCLSSKWRTLHMWVGDDADPDAVTDFGFSGQFEIDAPT